jgi:hypothetical protein
MAVCLKPKADGKPSTINDDSDVDSGYTAELRIPWPALGAPRERATWLPPAAGTKDRLPGPWKVEGLALPILAVVQDGDLKDRYHHSSPTFKGGWFHMGAADWPRYILDRKRGQEPFPAPNATTTPAPGRSEKVPDPSSGPVPKGVTGT